MEIAVVSDLHVGVSYLNEKSVHRIVKHLRNEEIDVLCILGDVSPDLMTLAEVLDEFALIDAVQFFVAGNHDLWLTAEDRKLGIDSLSKMKRISDVCSDLGVHDLFGHGPKMKDGFAFVGNTQWYDYSFRDSDLEVPDWAYRNKSWHGMTWNDGSFVRFGMDDEEVTDMFNDRIEADLEKTSGRRICCSHHIPFKILQEGMHEGPSFFNAFGGNERFGEILKAHGVEISVSGHLHRNRKMDIDGVRCYQTAVGYLDREYMYPDDPDWTKILKTRILRLSV